MKRNKIIGFGIIILIAIASILGVIVKGKKWESILASGIGITIVFSVVYAAILIHKEEAEDE